MAAPRNYAREAKYESTPEQIHNRVKRNAARREAIRDGLVKKGDGKDIDHKQALSKGGTNAKSNLRVTTASENRSFPRTRTGAMLRNT